jgi:hypothetical protein
MDATVENGNQRASPRPRDLFLSFPFDPLPKTAWHRGLCQVGTGGEAQWMMIKMRLAGTHKFRYRLESLPASLPSHCDDLRMVNWADGG